jgi:hypothetical protein
MKTVGLVGLSGLAVGCGSPSGAQTAATETTVPVGTTTTNGEVVSISHSFLIEPGMTSRIDPGTGEVLARSPWSLSSETASAVPMLLRSFTPREDEVDEFADEASQDVTPSAITRGVTSDPFAALMGVRLSNIPDVLDISGSALLAVLDGAELNLDLDFFHADPHQNSPVLQTISTRSGLPVEEIEGSAITRADPKSLDLFGWKFQFRSVHPGALGRCVRTSVPHFNLEIHHRRTKSRFDKILNVHIGTYREAGKRCFVLWENQRRKETCWKTCKPTLSDLVEMLKWVLVAAAVVAGVAIAAYLVTAIATAAAGVLFVPLLAL